MLGRTPSPAYLFGRDRGIGADLFDLGDEAPALLGVIRLFQAPPQIVDLISSLLLPSKIAFRLSSHTYSLPPDDRRDLPASDTAAAGPSALNC